MKGLKLQPAQAILTVRHLQLVFRRFFAAADPAQRRMKVAGCKWQVVDYFAIFRLDIANRRAQEPRRGNSTEGRHQQHSNHKEKLL